MIDWHDPKTWEASLKALEGGFKVLEGTGKVIERVTHYFAKHKGKGPTTEELFEIIKDMADIQRQHQDAISGIQEFIRAGGQALLKFMSADRDVLKTNARLIGLIHELVKRNEAAIRAIADDVAKLKKAPKQRRTAPPRTRKKTRKPK